MKKRKARFNDGGLNPYQGDDVDPFSAVRDEEGGTASRKEGPISEAFYEEGTGKELSTRRNLETGDYYSTEPVTRKAESARAAPKKAPSIKDVQGSGRGSMAGRGASDDIMYVTGGGRGRMAGRTAADEITYTPGRAGRAEIPTDSSMRGPARQFSPAMEMSDTGRALATTVGALGGAGAAAIRGAPAARTAISSAKGVAAPMTRAAKEGIEVAKTSGPRAGLETAQSTLRGMKSRADIQAKRSAGKRGEAEAMERNKPILQARPSTKAQRADRTRRNEDERGMEFSRGGSASSRADGCAKRGKTKGKLY